MKSTTFSIVVSIFLVIFFSYSCKKNSSTPNGGNSGTENVYVLGAENGTTMLWKNGVASSLPISVGNSSLYVSSSDVYVAGYTQNFILGNAFYTKNGIEDSLPRDSAVGALGSCVFVAGNTVYVAGTQSYSPDSSTTPFTTLTATYPIAGTVATVWTNGVESHLQSYGIPGGAGDSNRFNASYYSDYVSGIQVAGNDVYVSGGSHQSQRNNPPSYRFAEYWKNGVPTLLVNGLLDSSANAYSFDAYPATTGIAVAGSDVYVAGYESTSGGSLNAIYWKNGVPTYLSTSPAGSIANAIAVSGTDVYVAGYQNINDTSRAMLWKNGVAAILPYGTGSAAANAVFVSGADVYVAGYGWHIGGYYVSTYWKNGVLTSLTDGTSPAIANSIFVQ
jgi:hypothetical protein